MKRGVRGQIKLIPIFGDRFFIRGHTRGLADKASVATWMKGVGITMLMNVALIDDDEMEGQCWNAGIAYERRPMRDSKNHPIDHDYVRDAVLRAEREVTEGGAVVVHCDSGWNRSALVAVPAAALFARLPASTILRAVRSTRPKVLKNERFDEYVRENYG